VHVLRRGRLRTWSVTVTVTVTVRNQAQAQAGNTASHRDRDCDCHRDTASLRVSLSAAVAYTDLEPQAAESGCHWQ
jgi:hypothetical protein